MKQFFASFLGTILGIIVSIALLVFVVIGLLAATKSLTDKPYKVTPNSLLYLKLDEVIADRTTDNSFGDIFKGFSGKFSMKKNIGINDFILDIKKAKADSNIKGIYLDLSIIPSGVATVEGVRNALLDFKTSGKFIVSYSEVYTQKAYYLASVSDKIYINPQGFLEWKGISSQIMFYKGLLNKLDVEMQIFRHGKFKSAIEPFDLDKMSEENRKQIKTYVGSIWNHFLRGISVTRKIEISELNNMANKLLIQNADSAVKYGLIDEKKFKDELIDILKSRLNIKDGDKINMVSINEYDNSYSKKTLKKSKNKIALIYAIGEIRSGDGEDEVIGSEKISKVIREARKDTSVKAIVLRVNSPGGSALASDVIWREVVLAQKKKPVVVSMGDVAASGGYYIACAADAIVAEPTTITGSIGVFGILPNVKKLFNDKLGITIDTANTNKFSDFSSVFRPVTSAERMVIQHGVETIYNDFVSKVAEGRKMTVLNVDSVGQGRVWSGFDAKAIGLVDELGGIEKAIEIAAKKSKLDVYELLELPKLKDPIEELLSDFSDNPEAKVLSKELGVYYPYYQSVKNMINTKGVQARLPFELILE